MRKSIQNKVLLVIVLVLLFGCRAKKQLVSVNTPVEIPVSVDSSAVKMDNVKAEKIRLIQAQQTNFNTFSGKARTHLEIDGKGYDVTMNIRIQKNKQIWVSITAIAGIEVARAVITPDSIKIINKLQSIYLKKPFSYVYQYTGRQVNYKTVESLVIGNAVPEFISAEANQTSSGINIILSGIVNELNYQTTFSAGLKVISLKLSNPKAAQKLDVNNSSFIQTDGRILPSVIGINSVSGQNSIKANLNYIKTEFDQPLDTPFNEPKGYTLAN